MAKTQDTAGAHGPFATDKIETKTPGEPGDIVAHFTLVKLVTGEKGVIIETSESSPVPVGGTILSEILLQQKITNLHLAAISGQTITADNVS